MGRFDLCSLRILQGHHCQIRDHLKGNLKEEPAKYIFQVLFRRMALKMGLFCPSSLQSSKAFGVDKAAWVHPRRRKWKEAKEDVFSKLPGARA